MSDHAIEIGGREGESKSWGSATNMCDAILSNDLHMGFIFEERCRRTHEPVYAFQTNELFHFFLDFSTFYYFSVSSLNYSFLVVFQMRTCPKKNEKKNSECTLHLCPFYMHKKKSTVEERT